MFYNNIVIRRILIIFVYFYLSTFKNISMLKINFLKFIFLISLFLFYRNSCYSQIVYYDKDHFLIEGTSIPESEKESPYDRFPLSYKDLVRPVIWDLSKSSAGITIRFFSNSGSISVKWTLMKDAVMNHMAPTGIKGIDLYCKIDDHWQYVNTARPVGKENKAELVNNMSIKMREFKMFLPLYDGVEELEVGIDSLSVIKKPSLNMLKPIVYYGTSIVQGGCASRPGMAHTNIISRKVNRDCQNFGFSGNGKMEAPVVELISEIDALFYVIDCVPNMTAEEILENTIPLVEIIRKKSPYVPIVFVENLMYEKSFFDESLQEKLIQKNKTLKNEYDKMIDRGMTDLYYINTEGAIGDDHDATVDGVHFTDLGFLRFADFLITKFKEFNLLP